MGGMNTYLTESLSMSILQEIMNKARCATKTPLMDNKKSFQNKTGSTNVKHKKTKTFQKFTFL